MNSFVAGGLSGLAGAFVSAPFDLIKTRLQMQGHPRHQTIDVHHEHGVRVSSKTYTGIWSTFVKIFKTEGFLSLYRGFPATSYGLVPTWAIYFNGYEYFKEHFPIWLSTPKNSSWNHIFSSMSAGTISSILCNPIWVARTRIMNQQTFSKKTIDTIKQLSPGSKSISHNTHSKILTPPKYRTPNQTLFLIFKEEGIHGFYRGLIPSLLGTLHVAIQFPIYEKLKAELPKNFQLLKNKNEKFDQKNETHPNALGIVLASSVSKIIASSIAYPHEVIRTRFQDQGHEKTPQHYSSVRHCVSEIFHQEGWRAFYKGFATNLIRVTPTCAVTFLTYDKIMESLS